MVETDSGWGTCGKRLLIQLGRLLGKELKKELALSYFPQEKPGGVRLPSRVFIASEQQGGRGAVSAERRGLADDRWIENRSKPGPGIKDNF